MDIAVELISKLGFPIFVAVFLLFKTTKSIQEILVELKRTNVVLAVLVKVIDNGMTSGIPQEVVDEVSGVTEVPLIGQKKEKE